MTAKMMSCCQNRKVLVLQRVEKVRVPVVEPDCQTDLRALGSNDGSEKGAPDPAFLDGPCAKRTDVNGAFLTRPEVRGRKLPYGAELRSCDVQHSASARLGDVLLPGRA